MRLHRIRLQNYRGVDDCTVDFTTDGVTIIEGDNEVGKTCIPEALDLSLRFPDSSKAREVQDVRPVHRDAGPEVEVELTSGDYRFVYSKRWYRQSQTRLDVTEPRREQLTGREAHDRVREILDETLDSDLWEALCIEQGAQVTLPPFDVPSLGRALDAAAGGDSTESREDDLWERICAEREKYWTPTGQRPKERKDTERNLDEAREAVAALEGQLAGVEADAEEVERRLIDRERLMKAREDAREHEQKISEQWEGLEKLRAEVERLEAHHIAAVAKRDQIDAEMQRRDGLVQDLQNKAEQLAVREADAERAAPTLAAVASQAADADQALESAAEALSEARTVQRQANEDCGHFRRRVELAQLVKCRERVIEAQKVLSQAERHLEAARVDDELVEQIEKADRAVMRAEVAVQSAAASLDVTALSDLNLLLAGEEVELPTGTIRSVTVVDETRLTVPGIVQIGVTAGGGSRDVAAQLRDARDSFDRLCESGGVASLDEARRAAEQRKEAMRSRAEAIATIERDLGGLTLDVMAEKIEGLSTRVDGYDAERPADSPLPSGFEQAKRLASLADRAVVEQEEAHGGRSASAEQARDRLERAKLDEAVAVERIDSARTAQLGAAEVLEAERQERPDADLRASLAAAQGAVDTAAEELQEAHVAVTEADPDSLALLLESAGAAAKRAGKDLRANDVRLTELRASLKIRGEDGLHSQLSEAQSRLLHLDRDHDGTEGRARAAELLYETFAVRRAESRRRYLAPFKERIEQFGRIVFDPTFAVELDDDLRVVRRTFDGVTLDVDQLSVGAREQLSVLSRLACAVIVSSEGGGAPVVLDDALGWSDPSRLARMGAAIAAAGRECQVIVLTCTPGRYSHVGNAKVVTLPN